MFIDNGAYVCIYSIYSYISINLYTYIRVHTTFRALHRPGISSLSTLGNKQLFFLLPGMSSGPDNTQVSAAWSWRRNEQ
jgi:hypothetical protein